MEVEIDDEHLGRVLLDESLDGTLPKGVAKAFRRRYIDIRSAADERDFFAFKSWHYKKYEGRYSIRLNDQWRLIIDFEPRGRQKVVHIKEIVDYH